MPIMLSKLYDAPIETGISVEKAREASEEVAEYENRLKIVENILVRLEERMSASFRFTWWMIAIQTGLVLGTIWKVFSK